MEICPCEQVVYAQPGMQKTEHISRLFQTAEAALKYEGDSDTNYSGTPGIITENLE